MTEKIAWNDQIKFIQPLKRQKNKDEALKILKNLAAAVKPIMKRYNWSVGLLKEFYPKTANLLGLNVNRGQTICIRLRYAGNPDCFMSWHDVLGTMLHELVHNRISAHNAAFYKLLDKLFCEQEEDERNGLIQNGNVFEGKSYKLGRMKNFWGNQNQFQDYPPDRSILLKAAEKRQQQQQPDGRKLGGSYVKGAIRKPKRDVLADAAERRLRDELQCANNENYNDNVQVEIIEIEDNEENNNNNQLIHNENNNNMGKLNSSGDDEKNRQFLSSRNVDGKNLMIFNGKNMEKFHQFGSCKEELDEQNYFFQIFSSKKLQTQNLENIGDIDTLRSRKDDSNEEKIISISNIDGQTNFKVENQDTVGSSSQMQNMQWSCGSCTFLNHFQMEVCEMCEQPKQKKMRV